MSQDAIQIVREAEEAAEQSRQEAAAWAKQIVDEAVRAGDAKVREAIQTAEAECADMMREAEMKATKEAGDLASNLENKKAVIRARAERAMDGAVALVVAHVGGK